MKIQTYYGKHREPQAPREEPQMPVMCCLWQESPVLAQTNQQECVRRGLWLPQLRMELHQEQPLVLLLPALPLAPSRTWAAMLGKHQAQASCMLALQDHKTGHALARRCQCDLCLARCTAAAAFGWMPASL